MHLGMYSTRLKDYASVRAEIISYIEARVGIRMKTTPSNIRDPNAKDIGSLASKGHGSGNGGRDYSHVRCYGCGEIRALQVAVSLERKGWPVSGA